jgi:hypothetical protein
MGAVDIRVGTIISAFHLVNKKGNMWFKVEGIYTNVFPFIKIKVCTITRMT